MWRAKPLAPSTVVAAVPPVPPRPKLLTLSLPSSLLPPSIFSYLPLLTSRPLRLLHPTSLSLLVLPQSPLSCSFSISSPSSPRCPRTIEGIKLLYMSRYSYGKLSKNNYSTTSLWSNEKNHSHKSLLIMVSQYSQFYRPCKWPIDLWKKFRIGLIEFFY